MTNEQLTLPTMKRRPPNPPTGDELKERGIERALAAERAVVRRHALEAIEVLADRCHKFTADDIAEAWEWTCISFHHPNVAGGVIQAALKAGVMVRTGRYVPSTRASRRASMVAVYRSMGEVNE